jgi:hypothetical protein
MNKKERKLILKDYKFIGSVTDYTKAKELTKQARIKGFFATIVRHTCLGRIYIKENNE